MTDKTEKDSISPLNIRREVDAFYSELYSRENTKRVLKARSEGESLEKVGIRMGITRERVRQIEAKAIKKFCLWQSRNRIILKVFEAGNYDKELSGDALREYFGEYYSETVYLLRLCESSAYHYDASSDCFIID